MLIHFHATKISKIIQATEIIQETNSVKPIPTEITIKPITTQKSPGFSILIMIFVLVSLYVCRRKK